MNKVFDQVIKERYSIYNADCVKVMQSIPSDSVHYTITSPPFSNLYTYSNSDYDAGNCKTDEEFNNQLRYLVKELFRVMMPGRLVSLHCAQIPMFKQKDGNIGLKDFRGDLIRLFQEVGFIYHSEVTIWKSPVVEMQRTKALGLLHKQIKKDSAMCRQGNPDYLVTMRKPGDNPEKVTHTNESFPVDVWQQYASPVWMDIKQSNTLQKKSAKANNDERHIVPLQLEVIQRGIELWSNPGDIVFDPFGGIGSTGYMGLRMGRRVLMSELKESYFKCMKTNMKMAIDEGSLYIDQDNQIGGQTNLFDEMEK